MILLRCLFPVLYTRELAEMYLFPLQRSQISRPGTYTTMYGSHTPGIVFILPMSTTKISSNSFLIFRSRTPNKTRSYCHVAHSKYHVPLHATHSTSVNFSFLQKPQPGQYQLSPSWNALTTHFPLMQSLCIRAA